MDRESKQWIKPKVKSGPADSRYWALGSLLDSSKMKEQPCTVVKKEKV